MNIGDFAIPVMIFSVILYGLFKKCDVYADFTLGVKGGIGTAFSILAPLIGLFSAIGAFRASGAMDIITSCLSPVCSFLKIPADVVPFAVMRPVSGSGSLAMAQDIFKNTGADSFASKAVSVMMGSSETTFYTIAVYFGAVKVINTRYTLKCALLADLCCLFVSLAVCRLFFG